MKKLRIVWMDDNLRRVRSFKDVIEAGGKYKATLEPEQIRDNALEWLSGWVEDNRSRPPDLIIIDHVFNMSLPFGLKGSSVAHLLRRQLPSTPMVCVTAMFDHPKSFNQEDISEYSALFLYNHLSDHIEDIYAIAKDFRKLTIGRGKVREHIVKTLKAPVRDQQDLLRVLPDEFRDERHSTTEHRMAWWIYNTLLQRPGFLYDRLHAATLLGLTESGFEKVESQFEAAKYKGIFATSGNPRWWVSELTQVLFKLVEPDAPDLPQYAGRTLKGIGRQDHSVCYVSKSADPAPDAIVDTDATHSSKRRVVRREFSDRHPADPGTTPGFDVRLILKKTK